MIIAGGSAISVTARLRSIADAYPAEAAFTPAAERERHMTDEQRAAWSLRFEAPLPAIEVTV